MSKRADIDGPTSSPHQVNTLHKIRENPFFWFYLKKVQGVEMGVMRDSREGRNAQLAV
jgi:hypothetical protein